MAGNLSVGYFAVDVLDGKSWPIDVTVGGLLPQLTSGHWVPHLNSWVDWSMVSKVPCSRKQQ